MAVALAASQERFVSRGQLFMVADGMDPRGGRLASKLATDSSPVTYHKLDDLTHRTLKEAVLRQTATSTPR